MSDGKVDKQPAPRDQQQSPAVGRPTAAGPGRPLLDNSVLVAMAKQRSAGAASVPPPQPEPAAPKPAALDVETIAQIRRDAESIIAQAGAAFPDRTLIVTLVTQWGSKDRRLHASMGTPHLDKLFSILEGTRIGIATWRTVWQPIDTSALEAVIHLMEKVTALRDLFLSDLKFSAAYRNYFTAPEIAGIWDQAAIIATELRDHVEHGNYGVVTMRLRGVVSLFTDNVALALARSLPDASWSTAAHSPAGRLLLATLIEELSAYSYGADEAAQVERLLRHFDSGVDLRKYGDLENKMVVPIGDDSLVLAHLTDSGKVWVKVSYRVTHAQHVKNLPKSIAATGIELASDDVVGLVSVDSGDVPRYVPVVHLLVASNQATTEVLTKIATYAAAGASLPFAGAGIGSGLVSGVSEVAPALERGVALAIEAADLAAITLGYVGLLVDEMRPFLIRWGGQDAKDFLKYWDLLQHLTAVYGATRVAMDLAPVVQNADTLLSGLVKGLKQQRADGKAAKLTPLELEQLERNLAATEKRFSALKEQVGKTAELTPLPQELLAQTKPAGKTKRLTAQKKLPPGWEKSSARKVILGPPTEEDAAIARDWLARNKPGPASPQNEARLQLPPPPPPPSAKTEAPIEISLAGPPKQEPPGVTVHLHEPSEPKSLAPLASYEGAPASPEAITMIASTPIEIYPTYTSKHGSTRFKADKAQDLKALKAKKLQKPKNLSPPDEPLWQDYEKYWGERLEEIEKAFASGKGGPADPHTFESYRRARAQFAEMKEGVAGQRAVTERAASRAEKSGIDVQSNVGVSSVGKPTRAEGQVTFADQFAFKPGAKGKSIAGEGAEIAVAGSTKQRAFADAKNIYGEVEKDIAELVESYMGKRFVRRPGHAANIGKAVEVKHGVLSYVGNEIQVPPGLDLDKVQRYITEAAEDIIEKKYPDLHIIVNFY